MKHVHGGVISGGMVVDSDQTMNGSCVGDIAVIEGGRLKLNGACSGDLIMESGETVLRGALAGDATQLAGTLTVNGDLLIESGDTTIRGAVAGDVQNRGGNLKVYGVIKGDLIEDGGTTWVDPKAKIMGDHVVQDEPRHQGASDSAPERPAPPSPPEPPDSHATDPEPR